ncbi:hypothetical protein JCM17846_16860 [Iodidimonas nitroreducens]|uniref:Tubulin/FtsZ 2-layer sandwich domain-containing protein n=1 Tax=Iodidimonas nitroreducens TaxID=1236968 RepID=A0A5A7N8C0_9PROT|nr:hypothetical protein [Iodidimonas nitroreducens]GER04004.1 hypothetical protein JCM17846_16860 [Iodidimonas nitroreducens]
MMGTGEADGERRAIDAAEAAISNPLLDEVSLKGAKGVIINITGGMDLTLFEVDEAARHIREQVDEDANIIVGSAFNEALNGQIRVSVVATGIESDAAQLAVATPASAHVVNFSRPQRQGGAMGTAASTQLRHEGAAARAIEDKNAPHEDEAALLAVEEMAADESLSQAADDVLMSEPESESETAANPMESAEDQAVSSDAINVSEPAPLDEDVFIAPPPQVPHSLSEPQGTPDVFAQAAFENGARKRARDIPAEASQSDEPRMERGRGLFRRMAAFGSRQPAADKADGAGSAGDAAALKDGAKDGAKSSLGRLQPEDRPVPSKRGDEQLEIPAFLRRQIN